MGPYVSLHNANKMTRYMCNNLCSVIDLGIIDRYTEHKVLHIYLVILLALCNDTYGPHLVSILLSYNVILLIKYFICNDAYGPPLVSFDFGIFFILGYFGFLVTFYFGLLLILGLFYF